MSKFPQFLPRHEIGVYPFAGLATELARLTVAFEAQRATVEALRARWIVTGRKNKDLDDDASRVIAETRQYLAVVDKLLPTYTTALDFFNAMVEATPTG